MPHMMVRHEVADYDRWSAVFVSHAAAQRAAGLRVLHVLRDLENPNHVTMLFEIGSLAAAQGFTTTDDAAEAKVDAGVLGEPEIVFFA